jgi:hypothetical protein
MDRTCLASELRRSGDRKPPLVAERAPKTIMTRLILLPKPGWMLVVLAASLAAATAPAAQLQPETIEAFEQHVAAADREREQRFGGGAPFLWTGAAADHRQRLQNGELVIYPRHGKGDIAVEKGIVHHWIGGVFVPGRNGAEAVALLRDFDAYKRIYPASVEESKTVERHGNASRAFLRLRKHRIVTVVLNTEYQVDFARVDKHRWNSRSVSTRIAQVEEAGRPREQELPVGEDSGFLWRIVTLWRFEEADGGVYLECEVVALTRGVPFGLGWLIRPILRSFPRESLAETLLDTRNALLGNDSEATPTPTLSSGKVRGGTPATAPPPAALEAGLP